MITTAALVSTLRRAGYAADRWNAPSPVKGRPDLAEAPRLLVSLERITSSRAEGAYVRFDAYTSRPCFRTEAVLAEVAELLEGKGYLVEVQADRARLYVVRA